MSRKTPPSTAMIPRKTDSKTDSKTDLDAYAKRLEAAPLNNSENSPIKVSWFDVTDTGTKGKLGMTLCPGRKGYSPTGNYRRDIRADLEKLKADGVTVLIPTIEAHEFREQQIEDYFQIAEELGLKVIWYPVIDGSTPKNIGRFRKLLREIVFLLRYGDNVLIHCKAGLGRTGTFAACVLTRLGWDPKAAIAQTRATRHRTIEHNHQERFVFRIAGSRPTYAAGKATPCFKGRENGTENDYPVSKTSKSGGFFDEPYGYPKRSDRFDSLPKRGEPSFDDWLDQRAAERKRNGGT